jgi:glyoxylase-like metal-dependent hydrolase (beta-lactamase superfamily II)
MALIWLALLCALCVTPMPVSAAEALPFVLKEIGPGVYAAIDGPEGRSGSNAGFVIGDDGVLVVDSFYDPAAAKALLGEIRRLTPKPVRYLVNTHYHIDHVGGDAVFREAGAVIIAHRNVRGWVRTENVHLFGAGITPDQRAQIAALPLPDLTTEHDLILWLGARKVSVRVVKGHTGGDLAIAVPDARVLFCGDLLWREIPPNIIDGTVSQWIATVDGFGHAPDAAATTFVPGHGDLAKAADVADFEAYLSDLSRLTAQARQGGLAGEPLIAAVLPKLKALHGDWDHLDRSAPREIRYMEAELAGTKRVPVPVADAR